MRISDVARATGCSVRMIRHYHTMGLLEEPPRGLNGYRIYSVGDVAQVLKIRALSQAGISLRSIRAAQDPDELINEARVRLDREIAKLNHQKRLLDQLAENSLGLPEDIPPLLDQLLKKCVERAPELGQHISIYVTQERASLELMAHSGVATPDTWSEVRTILENLHTPELVIEWIKLGQAVGASEATEGWAADRHSRAQRFVNSCQELGLSALLASLTPGSVDLRSSDFPMSGLQLTVIDIISAQYKEASDGT